MNATVTCSACGNKTAIPDELLDKLKEDAEFDELYELEEKELRATTLENLVERAAMVDGQLPAVLATDIKVWARRYQPEWVIA